MFPLAGPYGLALRHKDDVLGDSYQVQGNEGYVRLEIVREHDGATLWLQPFWVSGK